MNSMFATHRLSLCLAAKYCTQHASAANQLFLVGTHVPANSETHHPSTAAYNWREDPLSKEFTVAYHGIPLLTKFRKKLQNLWWK